MKVILSGGTGFIGRALCKRLLQDQHEVVLLTRNPGAVTSSLSDKLRFRLWDAQTLGPWRESIEGADAVVNLAGEPVTAKRWTQAQKERIMASRVQATRAMVGAIAKADRKPLVLVNASAVGYYGHVMEETVTEEAAKGKGFLADVCEAWEGEARKAESFGVRVVLLRTGVVLGEQGGVLEKIIPPFRYFVGGPAGSGKQWFPWIHLEDVTGSIVFALHDRNLRGPVNVTSPNPVRMKAFCEQLGAVMHRPAWIPVPAMVLRILYGEMADVLLGGQRAIPQKLKAAGHPFRYPDLAAALLTMIKE